MKRCLINPPDPVSSEDGERTIVDVPFLWDGVEGIAFHQMAEAFGILEGRDLRVSYVLMGEKDWSRFRASPEAFQHLHLILAPERLKEGARGLIWGAEIRLSFDLPANTYRLVSGLLSKTREDEGDALGA